MLSTRDFKDKILQDIEEAHKQATSNLAYPHTPEIAHDLHHIGKLRGNVEALKNIYDHIEGVYDNMVNPKTKIEVLHDDI
jgi:hypothetical protein